MEKSTTELIDSVATNTANRDMLDEDWEKAPAVVGLLKTGHFDAAKEIADVSVATQTSEGKLNFDDPKPWLEGRSRAQSESTAMGYAVLEMYDETGDDRYLDAAERQYEFLVEDAVRTEGGTIAFSTEPVALWVDTIWTVGNFLAKYGVVAEDTKAFDEAVLHIREQAKYLQDPHAGLFRHEWQEKPNTYPESTFWARGNGWAVAGLVDVLDFLPDDHPDRDELLDILQKLSEAVAELQDDSGFWHHIMDDEWSPLETSATLQFSYGFKKGSELGYLEDSRYADAAADGFAASKLVVNNEGEVRRVAVPPGGPDVPFGVASYGQGFFLLAASQFE